MENGTKKNFLLCSPKVLILLSILITFFLLSNFQSEAQVPSTSNATASLLVNTKYNILNITQEMQAQISCYGNRTFNFNLSAEHPGNTGLNITLSRQGDIAAWISFSGNNSINVSLLSGETKAINFTVIVPSNASTGLYYINITALSEDSQIKVMNLSVNFSAAEICSNNFKNNLTTNFSELNETELGNVSNATIGIPNKGLINFFNQTIDFRRADLDSYINISHNYIEINTVVLSNLNKSAILTLYNLSLNNPIVLRDGSSCPASICSRITYNASNGTFVFNVSSFTVYSASDCGNGVCDTGESYSTCSADCAAPSPSQPSAGGGGGGGRPVIPVEKIPPTYAKGAKFTRLPVIKEAVIGESSVLGIYIQNILEQAITLELDVSGVPSEWISFKPETLTLEAGQTEGFTLVITLPEEAKTGDYKIDITASGDGAYAKDFFILRARRMIPEYGKPIVTKFVEIDIANEKTNVELTLQNPQISGYSAVEIIENIPKDLAEHSNKVEFSTTPTKIIQADPVIQWNLLDIKAGENRSILYSVKKILTELSPYIYWPLRQLNIITQKVPTQFKLVDLRIPTLYPGKTSVMTLDIENLDAKEHKFRFIMELPDDWQLHPEQIEEIIEAGKTKEFSLKLQVPRGAETGTYIVRALFIWDEDVMIREYPVVVQVFPKLLIWGVIILFILILIAYIISRITRLRYKPTKVRKISREDLLSKIREQIKESGKI